MNMSKHRKSKQKNHFMYDLPGNPFRNQLHLSCLDTFPEIMNESKSTGVFP